VFIGILCMLQLLRPTSVHAFFAHTRLEMA